MSTTGSSMLGGGATGQASPSAFTAPQINPTTLALLMRMQQQQNPGAGALGTGAAMAGAPQFPAAPQGGGAGGMMRAPAAGGAMPAGAGATPATAGASPLAGMLQSLMANPAALKQLLAQMGIGGAGMAAPAAGAAPGPGTGGQY